MAGTKEGPGSQTWLYTGVTWEALNIHDAWVPPGHPGLTGVQVLRSSGVDAAGKE